MGTADDTVKRRRDATTAAARRARRRVWLAPRPVRGHVALANGDDDDPTEAGEVGGADALEVNADAPGPHGGVEADEVVAAFEHDAALAGVVGPLSRRRAACVYSPSRPTAASWHAAV